jgi:ATP-dependent helicase HrpB
MVVLPIDAFVPEIVARVREHRAVVVTAPPGSGKTTRVPPALAAAGPLLLLQPRRIAARTIARRIADEQEWTLGREVGWHVRFERRFASDTRLIVATEGILTARLQQDPLLSGFHTIVLDEFHERSIHTDLGIALARQAWLARDDLHIVVMSATLDASRVSSFLGRCPVVDVPARAHPVDVRYVPGMTLQDAAREALGVVDAQVLCFLPGAPEIRRAAVDVQTACGGSAEVVQLHGSLDAAAQDAAIAAVPRRRIILATNIAETSITVPGVNGVIDTGAHKVARYDPDRAIDSLETERIPRDSAEQRAGRAGRLGPGVVWRLWERTDRLRPEREPDIHRIDLCGPVLDVLSWGGDPRTLEWFDPPTTDAIQAALTLLDQLGAATGAKITALGREMQRLPLHPRLARVLLASGAARTAAIACALLSERHVTLSPSGAETTTSDLLSAVEREVPQHVLQIAEELGRGSRGNTLSRGLRGFTLSRGSRGFTPMTPDSRLDEVAFRRAVLQGYPDRVARRRTPGSPRVLLASGHGAVVGPESGVRDGEYLVAVEVTAGRRGESSEARIRVASLIDREWLSPTTVRIDHEIDTAGTVRAVERHCYGAIVLAEQRAPVDPTAAARMLADAYIARGLSGADLRLVRRLRFAGIDVGLHDAAVRAALGCRSIRDIDLTSALTWEQRRELDRLAPETLTVPSGRRVPLDYREDGTILAAVKLQELFGLAETPTIGPRQTPVIFSLLAPNGRPVQTTADLRSFWDRTYPEVRKELRGRYPKHAWPEDPWKAAAEKPRRRG